MSQLKCANSCRIVAIQREQMCDYHNVMYFPLRNALQNTWTVNRQFPKEVVLYSFQVSSLIFCFFSRSVFTRNLQSISVCILLTSKTGNISLCTSAFSLPYPSSISPISLISFVMCHVFCAFRLNREFYIFGGHCGFFFAVFNITISLPQRRFRVNSLVENVYFIIFFLKVLLSSVYQACISLESFVFIQISSSCDNWGIQ
jgi:hypothetical protein